MSIESQATLEELIRELASEMAQVQRALAEQAGLNGTDLMALYFIRRGGEVTPKGLAEHLGLTTGATAIMLNRLEARRLITRSPHPTDRRGVLLSLGADANKAGFASLRDKLQGLNSSVFDSLNEEEQTIVRRFMSDLVRNTHEALLRIRADRSTAPIKEPAN